MRVLIEPASLALLNDPGLGNLSPEPPQKRLLRLILIDDDLDVIPRPEEEHVGIGKGRVSDGVGLRRNGAGKGGGEAEGAAGRDGEGGRGVKGRERWELWEVEVQEMA